MNAVQEQPVVKDRSPVVGPRTTAPAAARMSPVDPGMTGGKGGNAEDSQQQPPSGVDDAIMAALQNPKNRMNVLRMEHTMVNMIKNPKQHSVNLPPMNSFYRLLAHKVADHHNLGHTSNEGSSVSVYKLADQPARPNDILLADIGLEENGGGPQASSVTPTAVESRPKTRLLRNTGRASLANDNDTVSSSTNTSSPTQSQSTSTSPPPQASSADVSKMSKEPSSAASTPQGMGSFEAREAAYLQAKARIFNGTEGSNEDELEGRNDQQEAKTSFDPDYARYPMNPAYYYQQYPYQQYQYQQYQAQMRQYPPQYAQYPQYGYQYQYPQQFYPQHQYPNPNANPNASSR